MSSSVMYLKNSGVSVVNSFFSRFVYPDIKPRYLWAIVGHYTEKILALALAHLGSD